MRTAYSINLIPLQTYYLPRESISPQVTLTTTPRKSYCEWKGTATYYSMKNANTGSEIKDRIWSYESPSPSFKDIKGYISFYAGPWDCFVDGEKVSAQAGDFYGGWMTSEIEGNIKGGPGTMGW